MIIVYAYVVERESRNPEVFKMTADCIIYDSG